MRENRQKWIKALRSGAYAQTTGVLTRLDEDGIPSHCCLGVACVLYQEEVGDLEVSDLEVGDGSGVSHRTYDGYTGALPPRVQAWLGLDHSEGAYVDLGWSLIRLNDGCDSFAYIANVIEAEPDGLLDIDTAS